MNITKKWINKCSNQKRFTSSRTKNNTYDKNGEKNKRFADIIAKYRYNMIKEIYQVGKINKNGTPVKREVRAINDIMNSKEYYRNPVDIFFIPYNVENKTPIVYRKK